MTLVSDGERGIALAKGDWEDEFTGPPSNSDRRSSTTTPNSFNKDTKKPSVKYSIKDYKNMKQTGVKPSPKPMAADAERRPGHTRNTSGVSMDSPMSRMPSLEGHAPEVKQNGASFSSNSIKVEPGSRDDRLVSAFGCYILCLQVPQIERPPIRSDRRAIQVSFEHQWWH